VIKVGEARMRAKAEKNAGNMCKRYGFSVKIAKIFGQAIVLTSEQALLHKWKIHAFWHILKTCAVMT
jgi:hypothetical protein